MSEPATAVSPAPPAPREGWLGKKFIFFVALALALHVALIFVFATKKEITPRAVTNVPHLQVADSADEIIQLNNPTLFALPNAHDFVTAFWRRTPAAAPPDFFPSQPQFLLPAPQKKFGAAFRDLMKANPPRKFALNFKPEPKLVLPEVAFDDVVPEATTAEITGALAQRQLLTPLTNLPAISVNDVIAPSKVQVLVDTGGNASAVLAPLDSPLEEAGRLPSADASALAIARSLHFAPAPAVTFGEITFRWHVVPAANTNAP